MVGEFTPLEDVEGDEEGQRDPNTKPRRVTRWVDQETCRALKMIGLDTGKTTRALMVEAVASLFEKHNISTVTKGGR